MRETFSNRPAQLALAAFGSVIVVIGVAALSSGGPFGWVYLVIGAAFVARSLRSSSVVLGPETVETRSFVRTRRHDLVDLSRVHVDVGRTGMNSGDREYLTFERHDGSRFPFKEFNARPGDQSVVRSAEGAIQERLRRRG